MNKIQVKVDKETNYVYHMLSVARCGYDNEYGKKYSRYHKSDDLSILKKNEELLIVRGGEYEGALYLYLVSVPASGEFSVIHYYAELIDICMGKKKRSDYVGKDFFDHYTEYVDQILEIATVMKNNYEIYSTKIWPESKVTLMRYAKAVDELFDDMSFTDKAERYVGHRVEEKYMYVMFCNSLSYGAEAIYISENQDVFGIDRSYDDSLHFIGHEYIIFLLMRALASVDAFQTFDTYDITEGLAEFYMKLITGETRFFENQQEYVEFYEQKYRANPNIKAIDLYRLAFKKYVQV